MPQEKFGDIIKSNFKKYKIALLYIYETPHSGSLDNEVSDKLLINVVCVCYNRWYWCNLRLFYITRTSFFFLKYIVFISFSFVHTNITRSNHTTWLTVGGLCICVVSYFARLQQNLSLYVKLCMIARDNPYIGENEVNVLWFYCDMKKWYEFVAFLFVFFKMGNEDAPKVEVDLVDNRTDAQ